MAQAPTAFEDGIALIYGEDVDDKIVIYPSLNDPSLAGLEAPDGSIAFRPNGETYQKVGPLDTDWTGGNPAGSGGSGTVGDVPFCLADGSPDNIPLAGNQVPFLLANGTSDNIGLV